MGIRSLRSVDSAYVCRLSMCIALALMVASRGQKLEHQRLEAEARQRQEAIRLKQEQERQRIEAERLAEQQRQADELEERKRRREAEAARIAGIERAERDVALRIERRLQLIGAFCTGELSLPVARYGEAPRPQSVAVVSPAMIERVIPTLSDTMVWVADDANELFVSDSSQHRVQVFALRLPVIETAQPQENHEASAAAQPKRGIPPGLVATRTFGTKGDGHGRLHNPSGLDVSHYHVIICDNGNHRLVVFTKRGSFVDAFGSKGYDSTQFMDIRDVRLVNVRKVR
ncbi:hypothetical protein P43SY_002095 [Pythium insidiosum]|uniref:Uncharacterized protein n=1 Tax=Pythium insidiosum TaxID=114742 RepID=A0AAD5M851_PYTIN|nr:hypothetical protein P43SY_002095 [Pythium insidiosum]